MSRLQPLHVALLVTDLKRAHDFYQGVLGLPEKPRPNFKTPGIWYQLGALELHLILTTDQLTPVPARLDKDFHLAVSTDDYSGIKDRLRAAGIEFSENDRQPRQLFVRDPDGNLFEFQPD